MVAATELAALGANELLVDASGVPPESLIPCSRALTSAFSGSLCYQFEPEDVVVVEEILAAGARRVAVQGSALEDPDFMADVARRFGSEVLAVAISVRKESEAWRVYTGPRGSATEWDAITWARVAEAQGAAELIVEVVGGLSSDATYDLGLLVELTACLTIPVVARGDHRSLGDCLDALIIGNVDAVVLGPALLSGCGALTAIREYLDEHGVTCA